MNLANFIGFYTNIEEALQSTKTIRYLFSGVSIYQVLDNEIATFICKVNSLKGGVPILDNGSFIPEGAMKVTIENKDFIVGTDGLYQVLNGFNRREIFRMNTNIQEVIRLKIPKIPISKFLQIATFFKDICKKNKAEVMAQIWFNKETQKYEIIIPKQIVSGVHIDYEKDSSLYTNPNYLLVMDIHSHNVMQAFFSTTDDKDEQETRFYGVLGLLDKPTFGFSFRTNVGGNFVSLNMNHLFMGEVNFKAKVKYPKSQWNEKIVITKSKILTDKSTGYYDYKGSSYGGGYGGGYDSYHKVIKKPMTQGVIKENNLKPNSLLDPCFNVINQAHQKQSYESVLKKETILINELFKSMQSAHHSICMLKIFNAREIDLLNLFEKKDIKINKVANFEDYEFDIDDVFYWQFDKFSDYKKNLLNKIIVGEVSVDCLCSLYTFKLLLKALSLNGYEIRQKGCLISDIYKNAKI